MSVEEESFANHAPAAGAFVRYLVVGAIQNGVMLGAVLLLEMNGLAVWQAMGVCYPVAIVLSFVANKLWSFSSRPRRRGQFLGYAVVYACAYPFAMAVAWLGESAGLIPAVSAVASIVASAVFIFCGLSFWVFRSTPRS